MSNRGIFLRGAAASAILVGFASPCFAEAVAPVASVPTATTGAPEDDAHDIIVTAEKRSERLKDVPLTVAAATSTQLKSRGITSANDLTKIVPGFTYQQSDFGAPILGIRGVSFFSVSSSAVPAVAVYVDQIPIPYSRLTLAAPLDVERVEVLEGPQGTLFGESTTGGAINYIAAKPTDHLVAGGDVLYGRFSQVEVEGYVGGPISDTLTARLSGRTEQRADWQKSVSRNDSTGQHNLNEGRLLLDFKPASNLRFELNVNGFVDRSDSPTPQFRRFVPSTPGTNPMSPAYAPAFYAFAGPASIPPYTVGTVPPGLAAGPIAPVGGNARAVDFDPGVSLRNNDRFFQTALTGELDIGGIGTLTSLSSYERYDGAQHTDPDGTPYNNVATFDTQTFRIFSQELRASGTAGALKWTVGGYYEYNKLSSFSDNFNEGTNSAIVGIHYDKYGLRSVEKINTKAGFGGIDYDLGHHITLQGSVRYTAESRKWDGCTYAPDEPLGQGLASALTLLSSLIRGTPTPPIQLGQCITLDTSNPGTNPHLGLPETVIVNTDRHNTDWKLGASWKPDRNAMLYFSVTKGYKGGGVSSIPSPASSTLFAILPESVLVYEGGIKASVPAARVSVEAAGFHYDYTNKQTGGRFADPLFGNLPALVNVPKSAVDGGQISVNWRPVTGLNLNGSLVYSDARVTKSYLTPDPLGKVVDVNGEQLPGSNKWQALGDAEYRFPVASNVNAYVGGSVTYHSSSFAQFGANPDFALPSYTLVDLRAGLAGENDRWLVELFGHNVTNKYYWTNVSVSGDVEGRYAAMPVTYGVRASFKFGN